MGSRNTWFRLYFRTVDDDKLRLLAFEDRWHFIALCCLKGEGLLDEPESDIRSRRIAVRLGVQLRELEEIARRLREVGLVDEELQPLAWDELQFKSDTSTERTRKYRKKQEKQASKSRERHSDVPVTVQDTDTETETEAEDSKGAGVKKSKKSKKRKAPIAKPDDVDAQVWDDFIDHRAKKSAPITLTVLSRLRSEADKAGWSLQEAIVELMVRGWQGFKADWVANSSRSRGKQPDGFTSSLDEELDIRRQG